MLAFAGGVMLSISFLQLIPESLRLSSVFVCVAGVTTGVIVMFALDKLIPHIHPELCTPEQGTNLQLTAIYLILGIFSLLACSNGDEPNSLNLEGAPLRGIGEER